VLVLLQVLSAREAHIAELKAQIQLVAESEGARAGEQKAQLVSAYILEPVDLHVYNQQ
jgi:hypothetical protein